MVATGRAVATGGPRFSFTVAFAVFSMRNSYQVDYQIQCECLRSPHIFQAFLKRVANLCSSRSLRLGQSASNTPPSNCLKVSRRIENGRTTSPLPQNWGYNISTLLRKWGFNTPPTVSENGDISSISSPYVKRGGVTSLLP